MREEQYERIKKLAKDFDKALWRGNPDNWRSVLQDCFYGMFDILTECKECNGKGYVMSLRDEIEYEKWQERGELNESENSNPC